MFTPQRLAAAGVLAVAALALAACSDSQQGPGSAGTLTWSDSPLDKYTQGIWDSAGIGDEEAQVREAERQRRYEELVAQCMTQQGFDYTPVSYPDDYFFYPTEEESSEGPEWGTVEYAEQFGYGVFTWFDAGEEPAAPPDGGAFDTWEDPNAWIYTELSESELRAWEEALWGAPSDDEWNEEAPIDDWEWNWEDAGCQGFAQHELDADDPFAGIAKLIEEPQFAELFAEMENLYTVIDADPRFGDLDAKWSACMAGAGYDFANPGEAMDSIYALDAAFWEDHYDDPDYPGPSQDETAQAREQELATAVADMTCQEELNYATEQLRIRFEVEQKFLDENKARLDEFTRAVQASVGDRTTTG